MPAEIGELRAAAIEYTDSLDDRQRRELLLPARHEDYKQVAILAAQLVEDVWHPVELRRWLERPVGLVTPLHIRALGSGSRDDSGFTTLRSLAACDIVDFGALSWDEVLRLRRSRFREEFRQRIEEVGRASTNVEEALRQDLFGFLREAQPSLRRTTISGILGNLPIAPVNPISVIASIAQAQRDAALLGRYGWLYFLLEANPLLD